jgi:hypothetical protein
VHAGTLSQENSLVTRLSIVIPHSDSVERLENTLVSVLENRPADSQVLVVQSEQYDDPYGLKDEVTFAYAPIGTDTVRCLNVGIDMATSPVIHLLLPGLEVTPGWADAALRGFDDPSVTSVAPLMLVSEGNEIVSAGLQYRAGGAIEWAGRGRSVAQVFSKSPTIVGPDLRAAFYRQSALRQVGRLGIGFDEPIAAVDLALKLRQIGGRCVIESHSRVRVSDPPRRPESAFRRAAQSEQLFWRWSPQAGWVRSMIEHVGQVAADVASGFPGPAAAGSLLGHLVGACGIMKQRSERRRLIGLQVESDDLGADIIPGPHCSRGQQSENLSALRRSA